MRILHPLNPVGLLAVVAIVVPASILSMTVPSRASTPIAAGCTPSVVHATGPYAQLANASNTFGFRLLKTLMPASSGGNTFVSPFSASMALGMTFDGSRGTTRTAMARALSLGGLNLNQTRAQSAALLSALVGSDPKVRLDVGNALWARKGITFVPTFLQHARTQYGAKVSVLDFSSPSALATINSWASCATRGKIQKIVDQIPAQMILYLMNAVYFEGTWSNQFQPDKTHSAPFTTLAGSQSTVSMMNRTLNLPYYKGTNYQMASLPFGSGRYGMVVLLPDKGVGLGGFVSNLASTWNASVSHLAPAEVALSLPRFSLAQDFNLNKSLQSLGMGPAFDRQHADFSGMCTTRCAISQVRQKTYLQVTEAGATAAAVTSVGIIATAVQQTTPMVVDHPFVVAIRDSTTGTVLFVGSIGNPRS